MDIKLANTAGFCFGVRRAVNTVYEEIEKALCNHQKIYTYNTIYIPASQQLFIVSQ